MCGIEDLIATLQAALGMTVGFQGFALRYDLGDPSGLGTGVMPPVGNDGRIQGL